MLIKTTQLCKYFLQWSNDNTVAQRASQLPVKWWIWKKHPTLLNSYWMLFSLPHGGRGSLTQILQAIMLHKSLIIIDLNHSDLQLFKLKLLLNFFLCWLQRPGLGGPEKGIYYSENKEKLLLNWIKVIHLFFSFLKIFSLIIFKKSLRKFFINE